MTWCRLVFNCWRFGRAWLIHLQI